jgi:hypothetical protein
MLRVRVYEDGGERGGGGGMMKQFSLYFSNSHPLTGYISPQCFPYVTPRGCGGKAVKVRVFDSVGTAKTVERQVMEGRGRLL